MLTEQIKSGNEYGQIRHVISILITDHTLITGSGDYHHRFTLYDPEKNIEFTDILEVHTLELTKLPVQEDGTELWDWMRFLSSQGKEEFEMIAEKNPQVKKAVVRLLELSADEETRLLYDARQKMIWDNTAREDAARAEGEAKGKAEGETTRAIAIAQTMLEDGEPMGKIVRYTGLAVEEIEGLRRAD